MVKELQLFEKLLIGVQWIYDGMLVSGVQQMDSVIHIFFHYGLLQEYSSLCYTIGLCYLSILCIMVSIC